MFGHNNISWTPINNLLMAEMKTFNATSFDVEPTDSSKAGQYVTATWTADPPHRNFTLKFSDGSSGGSGHTSATALVNWLQANEVGPPGHKSKGQGVKFESLSPADAGNDTGGSTGGDDGTGDGGTAKDCATENREAGATDTECGDCLSGFTADATGVCVADVADDETETETNWLIYGVIGVALIGGIFFLK